ASTTLSWAGSTLPPSMSPIRGQLTLTHHGLLHSKSAQFSRYSLSRLLISSTTVFGTPTPQLA
ncbi:MAG: hypothetical protein M3220_18700, partial [Chloroflexota bacterium]|nr:hypothetical protein [Chloroflexota bacterium]